MLINRFILVALLCCVLSCATPSKSLKPRLVPKGWVADYDYVSDLSQYLKKKYEVARGNNKKAYAYFYGNSDSRCQQIRTVFSNPILTNVTDENMLIMLERDYFVMRLESPIFDSGLFPIMMQVAERGHLIGPVLYPSLYLFHHDAIPEPRLRREAIKNGHNRLLLEDLLARRLVEYFSE